MDEVFSTFSGGKPDMDSRQFTKLCRDSELVDSKFTAVDADLIFAKVKPKTGRRVTMEQFNAALDLIAKKKGVSKGDIEGKVKSAKVVLSGTVAEPVKFHDDKALYTGVHAHGGPSTVDSGRSGMVGDLSETLDRSAADARGVKMGHQE